MTDRPITMSARVLHAGMKLPDPPDLPPPPEYKPGLLTQLAVWWLRRQWADWNQILPDMYYVMTVELNPDQEIVIGPCVIEPPGLSLQFESESA